ncbi:hypothetical protein [Tenacibaculum amylolyticum]
MKYATLLHEIINTLIGFVTKEYDTEIQPVYVKVKKYTNKRIR